MLAWTFAAVVWTSGCSKDNSWSEDLDWAARRSSWEATAETGVSARVVAIKEVPTDLSTWKISGATVRVRQAPGANGSVQRGLQLIGTACSVEIPTESAEFSAVRVDLIADRGGTLGLECGQGSEATSSTRELLTLGDTQSVVLMATAVQADGPAPGSLRVTLSGHEKNVWIIQRVHLIAGPPLGLLPDPKEERSSIRLGSDARPAVGLGPEIPLRARFEPNGRPSRFVELSVGLPSHVSRSDGSLCLRVFDEQEEIAQSDVQLPGPNLWKRVRIKLPTDASVTSIEASLTQSEAEGGFGCLITDPELLPEFSAPPSILFVTSDTHRADHVGLVNSDLLTQSIDGLSQDGVFFDNCWSTTNLTIPSHVAMLTGAHPRDTSVINNATRISGEAHTLAEAFAATGYRTLAVVSSRHLRDTNSGLGQGFDRMSWPTSGPSRSAEESIAVLNEWLDEQDGQPLFFWLHLFDAHHPYTPPVEFQEMYGLTDVPKSILSSYSNLAQARQMKPLLYAGEVSYLDSQIGQVFSHDRFRAGFVAMTADHGENLGEGGHYWNHKDLYPSAIRVPLILRAPGLKNGNRISAGVSNVDVGRTMLNWAGMEDMPWHGRDLRYVDDDDHEEPVFTLSSNAEAASMTSGGWHLILDLLDESIAPGGSSRIGMRHWVRLFDLRTDPNCKSTQTETERDRTRSMRAALIEWLSETKPVEWTVRENNSQEILAELEALGYTTSSPPADAAWIDPNCGCAECLRF